MTHVVISLRGQLDIQRQALRHDTPTIIYQDNTSTIVLANKGRSDSERTKHVSVRYFFIKNYIEKSELFIRYLPSLLMLADSLAKPLQGALLNNLKKKLFD
jgi:hypothetical protein